MLPRRIIMGVLAVGILTALFCADLKAQYVPYYQPGTGRYSSPPVSPYLNLLRGNNTAVNYYLGVRTEFDRRLALQQQLLGEERLRMLTTEVANDELFPKLAGTGHPATFMNYGSYFTFSNAPVGGSVASPLGKKR
jgi:hypothetical protein